MIFYVYEDWTLEVIPRCFYVGKGKEKRVREVKRNRLHKHVRKQFGFERLVVFLTSDEQAACAHERDLVAEHHTFVRDPHYNGVGCNFTEGGEGTSGFTFTLESRVRMSARKIGRRLPLSHRENMRISHIRRYELDGQARKQRSEQWKEIWQRPEFREKMSSLRRGRNNANAKLTEEDVISVRLTWNERVTPLQGELKKFCLEESKRLGVTDMMIYHIIKRKSWTHI